MRHTNQLRSFYTQILIDIVSESYVQGRTFYVTEKTLRPMLLKKPFIVMGPKCFLIHLRQMGFRTFGDFWNEDYNGYEPGLRYQRILELIDDLAKRSHSELVDMYKSMQDVLDHNYNMLVQTRFQTDIHYVE